MDMFVFSYVNELCIYLRLCLSSSWFCLRLRTNKDSTNLFYSDIALLIYVNETCLSSRFMSIVLWPRTTHLVPMLSQNACVGEGPGATLSLETSPFYN